MSEKENVNQQGICATIRQELSSGSQMAQRRQGTGSSVSGESARRSLDDTGIGTKDIQAPNAGQAEEAEGVDFASLPFVYLTELAFLPTLPGLYFVLHEERLLYIGESYNIWTRWRAHHVKKKLPMDSLEQARLFKIAWLEISDIKQRLLREKELIRHLRPELNDTYNRASPVPAIEKILSRSERPTKYANDRERVNALKRRKTYMRSAKVLTAHALKCRVLDIAGRDAGATIHFAGRAHPDDVGDFQVSLKLGSGRRYTKTLQGYEKARKHRLEILTAEGYIEKARTEILKTYTLVDELPI